MIYSSQYFYMDEFTRQGPTGDMIDWYPRLSQDLLIKLDLLRYHHGLPIYISHHPKAIGRFGNGSSYHFFETHGEVKAIDIMPEGIYTKRDVYRFIELIVMCGFTGFGFYPHWEPNPGFHVDVRPGRKLGDPAKWGAIKVNGKQEYVSLQDAIDEVDA